MDLYDVSNPRRPRTLVQGFGDTGPDDGSLVGDEPVHDAHSVFVWQDGRKAYLFIVDNLELHDVDIFDITNPRKPQPVAEYDLVEQFPDILDSGALGDLVLFHDGVVKEIDGRQVLMAAHWDAGYVTVDVSDPANIAYSLQRFRDPSEPWPRGRRSLSAPARFPEHSSREARPTGSPARRGAPISYAPS